MTAFEERMQALRARFVGQACAEADHIEEYARRGDWRGVRDLAHGIAGRAGMFGFSTLSEEACVLENAIDRGEASARLAELSAALTSGLRHLADC
jgi:HPt (histidine-containing phosphotransfer) domain-containing protein